jgi:Restriction endonuclease
MSPNLDQHPNPLAMVQAMCAANRQPERGRFREPVVLERTVGRKAYRAMVDREDVVPANPGPGVYLDGWDEWQEGDMTVAERMRRHRARKADKKVKTGRERTAEWRLKGEVLARDGFVCRYCGAYEYPREFLVAEHVIPHPAGPTDIDNLVTACIPCNVRKGSRTPEEAGMILRPIGYRSTMDPLGDTPRVTRVVTRGDASQGVTVTTTALEILDVGSAQAIGVDNSPPPPVGRRKDGTNPRAVGANPRANGTSPRQERAAEKRGGAESLAAILRRAAAEGTLP